VVLVIAGLDPSGGAGLLLDARVVAELGGFPLGVATALTVQDTTGVESYEPVPPALVERQLARLAADFQIAAIKIGMLGSAEVAASVTRALAEIRAPVVLDPVLRSSGGATLLEEPASLAPLVARAALVTPNLAEAEALAGGAVRDLAQMDRAGQAILAAGAQAVLIKGGHLEGAPTDLLVEPGRRTVFEGARSAGEAHGTGCALSASIAARIARGDRLHDAVAAAKAEVAMGIAGAMPLGRGRRVMMTVHRR
jgi:hydroxymethylpyrimidine/phosphomethylpyrimidine kinase